MELLQDSLELASAYATYPQHYVERKRYVYKPS